MIENDNENLKKARLFSALGIALLAVLVIGAAYAYWGARASINFNTATISYETSDKFTVTLNGTNGIITLGSIEGIDMTLYSTNKVYYASETGKTETPTEVKIGEATPSYVNDTNTYECEFTLALTHSGTNDLIDKFLSNEYTNRSEGQLILTVNGEEYDIDDGFPNTITGTLDTDLYHPGAINVGFKFINLRNVEQGYLINTNGAININVTSFTCEPTGDTSEPVTIAKYWQGGYYKGDYPYIYGLDNVGIVEGIRFDDYEDLLDDIYMIEFTNSSTEPHGGSEYYYRTIDYYHTLSECQQDINNVANRITEVLVSHGADANNIDLGLTCTLWPRRYVMKEEIATKYAEKDAWRVYNYGYLNTYNTYEDCYEHEMIKYDSKLGMYYADWPMLFNDTVALNDYGNCVYSERDNGYRYRNVSGYFINNSFLPIDFDSESECQQALATLSPSPRIENYCELKYQEGELIDEIKESLCLLIDDELKCMSFTDQNNSDSIWNQDYLEEKFATDIECNDIIYKGHDVTSCIVDTDNYEIHLLLSPDYHFELYDLTYSNSPGDWLIYTGNFYDVRNTLQFFENKIDFEHYFMAH